MEHILAPAVGVDLESRLRYSAVSMIYSQSTNEAALIGEVAAEGDELQAERTVSRGSLGEVTLGPGGHSAPTRPASGAARSPLRPPGKADGCAHPFPPLHDCRQGLPWGTSRGL
ncbi:hypothetical protein NDU88_002939 [Pleurodeles waltl]|uniref:Cyclic nucleotide-binding domain-containing protein n=1 Tax=Pleurodeles waltl TaxID=8319 RepID=A0AAV7UCC5_PLEWA|nr:hypothetical protein NDU88_002939 [Pleurodeles waltl]